MPLEAAARRLIGPKTSGAVITDRTAFEAGPSSDGSVLLAADKARDIAIPGVALRARQGSGPLAVDFSTLAAAQEQLGVTNAFRDPQQADAEGVRLVLP